TLRYRHSCLPPSNPADPQHRAQDYAGCENDRSDSDFPRSTDLAAYVNAWNHRHARTQHTLQVLLIIEHDLHRHALNYFHIIARRVFRRQQTESRATASLNAVYASTQFDAGVSIHGNVYRLARMHIPELRLFEIGDYPNSRR